MKISYLVGISIYDAKSMELITRIKYQVDSIHSAERLRSNLQKYSPEHIFTFTFDQIIKNEQSE